MEGFRVVRLEDLDRVPLRDGTWWRPVRRQLGVTGAAVNAYTGERAGDEVIEPHDELALGAGGHEELYVVLTGRARFTVGEETIEAPAGTLVLVDRAVHRRAIAAEADTTVLVTGGPPGAALPPSPFEYWYAAGPFHVAGDHARAAEIAAEGLAAHPENASLRYQLACYCARAGQLDEALEHLERAVAGDPRVRGWAAGDEDLDPIRDDPRFPR